MSSYSEDSAVKWNWEDTVCLLLLGVAVLLLFLTSPRAGNFWWSDAPRHAMDGVFYYDLARALPFSHPKQWAMDYYLQYPALSVLFYPPLFPLVEAVFFGLFGVSNAVAQLTVSAFLLATACGAYFLTRQWVSRTAAFATALLFIGTPGMALWGRQVMLEVPAFAFVMWSAYFLFRYLRTRKPLDLYLMVLLVLAGVYTKQTIIFISFAYLLTLLFVERATLFRRREIWWSAALFTVGIVPLALFTWFWGRLNVQQFYGGAWVEYSRSTLSGWAYVARQWPYQMTWIVVALATLYCVGAVVWKGWRLAAPVLFFLAAWLITGYVFFSVIAIKSRRYVIFLIFSVVFLAVLAIVKSLPSRIGPYIAIALAIGVFAHTLLTDPVPYVSGYRDAAQYVCTVAPPNSIVLFSGLRDGSFIFNVKSMRCNNLAVIRADKLLLRVPEDRRLFGVTELGVTESQFRDMLQRYGVRYIVLEPNFWMDLKSMQMLVRILHQDQFRLLTTVPVVSNREHDESQLEIYENLAPVSAEKDVLRVELPAFGLTVEGKVGQGK